MRRKIFCVKSMVIFLIFKMALFYYENTQGKRKLHRQITGKKQGILLSEMSGNHVKSPWHSVYIPVCCVPLWQAISHHPRPHRALRRGEIRLRQSLFCVSGRGHHRGNIHPPTWRHSAWRYGNRLCSAVLRESGATRLIVPILVSFLPVQWSLFQSNTKITFERFLIRMYK